MDLWLSGFAKSSGERHAPSTSRKASSPFSFKKRVKSNSDLSLSFDIETVLDMSGEDIKRWFLLVDLEKGVSNKINS